MGGGKETPRQKMIGLMYLVLMALLAMNVSKEVILAFVTLNDKIESGIQIVETSTANELGSFEKAKAGLLAQKAGPEEMAKLEALQGDALQVRKWTRELSNEFVRLTSEMIKLSQDGMFGKENAEASAQANHYYELGEGEQVIYKLMPLSHLEKKDDYDTPSNMFIGIQGDFKNPEGMYIKDSLTNYRDRLCKLIADHAGEKEGEVFSFTPPEGLVLPKDDAESRATFRSELLGSMSTVDPKDTAIIIQLYSLLTPPEVTDNHGEEYPWVAKLFDHTPMVAAAAMFTSLRSDIVTAENKAITHISSRVQAPAFNFNKIEPLAFSKKSLIPSGDSIGLKVMIAAYDSTKDMELQYWIDDSTKTPENMLEYSAKASSELKIAGSTGGKHTVYGNIAVEEKGVKKWKKWEYDFFVSTGGANATVSAYDLNVFYTGWDNRVKVSAGGVPEGSKITASCSGCSSFTQKGEFYIAKVKKVGQEVTVSVKATTPDGKSISMGEPAKFRVFPLPKPQPYYAGKSIETAQISSGVAKQCPPILAKLPNSPLDVKYTVTGFEMVVIKGGKAAILKSKSKTLTGAMKNAVKSMGKGSTLSFTQIKAKGPSGSAVPIGNLTFTLK